MASILFDFNIKRLLIDGSETELLNILKSVKELVPHFREIKIISGTEKIKISPLKETQVVDKPPEIVNENEEVMESRPQTVLPPVNEDGEREASLPDVPGSAMASLSDFPDAKLTEGAEPLPTREQYRRRVGTGGSWRK